jgi:hypothetical protein
VSDPYQNDFRHDHDGPDYHHDDFPNARYSTDMHLNFDREHRDVRPDL